MPVPKARCRLGVLSRSSRSGCSFASGSMLAAASMAMILSPFLSRTPPSSTSLRTKRGLENCTGETKRRNSSTARLARLQSSSSQSRRLGFFEQLVDRSADQVRGGFRCPRPAAERPSPPSRRALMRPPSFSTRTSSAISPSPPCRARVLQGAPPDSASSRQGRQSGAGSRQGAGDAGEAVWSRP